MESSKVGSQVRYPLTTPYMHLTTMRLNTMSRESDEKEIRQLSHDAKLSTPAPVLLEEY